MRINPNHVILLACCVMLTCSAASITMAQNDLFPPAEPPQSQGEADPMSKLLAERQADLNERLENLRRTEESLGENHPSLNSVRIKIQDLERELETFSDGENSLSDMSDAELRAYVLKLAIRVDRLERRISNSRSPGPKNRSRGGRPGNRVF